MKRVVSAAVFCLLLVSAGSVTPPARAGTTTQYRYTAPIQAFSRNYLVYEPSSRPFGKVPLIVYLHGCSQTAADAAVGTRWNETAEAHGFVVAYPEQDRNAAGSFAGTSNGSGCWNWFRPENNQSRGSGEPATIAGITQQVMANYDIDPRRVYVLGASAGADMAVILGATYPDLFAAFGSLAGCPYRSCADATGQLAFQAMGPRARVMPVFIAQGTADPVNNYAMSEALLSEWLGVNDLADDGAMNGSIPRTPASIENHGLDASVAGGLGDPGNTCVGSNRFPCLGGALGLEEYPYTITKYAGAGDPSLIEFWTIHGGSHAYPNGNPQGSFTDPLGPDINGPIFEFFMAHPMPGDDPVVDEQPPTITMFVDPEDELAPSGWYNALSSGTDGVLVHVAASDGSGVTNITCIDGVGEVVVFDTSDPSGSFTLADGAHAVSCRATDGASPANAGAADGSTDMPIVLDVDQTAPTASGAPDRVADHNGWYNAPVDVIFGGEDATSGVDSCTIAMYAGPDGSSATADGTCTDEAGNTGDPVASLAFAFDDTDPAVSVTGVEDGGSYGMGAVPEAACETTDNMSGVESQAGLGVSGGNSNGAGPFSASCSGAVDAAGNPGSTAVADYSVKYSGVSEFLAPLAKAGDGREFAHNRPVPAKFRIALDEPVGFDTRGWTIERIPIVCDTNQQSGDPEPAPSNTPATTIRYDADTDKYVYVADFHDVEAPSCWKLRVTLDDGPSPTSLESPVFRVVES